jgi:hypothetical protein
MSRNTNNGDSPRFKDAGSPSDQSRPKRRCDGLLRFDRYCGAQNLRSLERHRAVLSRFRCTRMSHLFRKSFNPLVFVVQSHRTRSKPDCGEYFSWRLRAAQGGDANAQFYIGRKYEIGLGLPKDPALATQWYIRAANQGNLRAQECLATMYAEGRCVPPDDPTAAYWHRRCTHKNPRETR